MARSRHVQYKVPEPHQLQVRKKIPGSTVATCIQVDTRNCSVAQSLPSTVHVHEIL